jgi:hypothetical protein
MRTKTLLLTAALSAAGIATSMAQVFSVNAVGYVNTPIVVGFNLISNPLNNTDNSIANLFKGAPVNTAVYKYEQATGFTVATMDEFDGVFLPAAAAATTVVPGEGVFVLAPTAFTVTFVGEVPQGALKNPIPAGLSIRSSQVPQAGTASELGLVGKPNDVLYQFNTATQLYEISTFDEFDGVWNPPLKPLKVGEAVFLNLQAPTSWDRTFSVNQ